MSEKPKQETELERRLRERAEAEERETLEPEHELTEAPPEPGEPPVDFEEEEAETPLDPVSALEEECEALKDQLLRSRAEFENFRKRTAREVDRIRKTAAESVIHELLTVMDNLELALKHAHDDNDPLSQGVRMVLRQMQDVLARNGLEPIEAVGKPFDPNVHEAIAQTETENLPPDHVVEEYQRGYTLGGQILRPSKVVVSRATSEAASES